MAETVPDSGEPLDVKRIHYLVRLMKRYDLTDLNLSDGRVQIRLRRRGPESASPPLNMAGAQLVVPVGQQPQLDASSAVASPASAQAPTAPQASPASRTIVIESPMVGTYYSSGSPDSPPFVSVGSAVQPDSILCIIEAMKVFTDIPAGVSGTITEILVKNGQPVEFGQPLFKVIPA
jgi:acetyl-CoA carboxylase biotin carboxyl carrier protein